MLYKPSKKEIKKIKNLNKAYSLIKEGMELIKNNIKKDIDNEFIHIINSKDKS